MPTSTCRRRNRTHATDSKTTGWKVIEDYGKCLRSDKEFWNNAKVFHHHWLLTNRCQFTWNNTVITTLTKWSTWFHWYRDMICFVMRVQCDRPPTRHPQRGPNPDSRSNIQFAAVQGTEEQRKGHQEKIAWQIQDGGGRFYKSSASKVKTGTEGKKGSNEDCCKLKEWEYKTKITNIKCSMNIK